MFYGPKNIQNGKVGDIIYIPATSRLDEQTKLSGPSPLRELIQDILKKLVKSSKAFHKLTGDFGSFAEAFKAEETEDERSLTKLESAINEEIDDWDAAFELDINPVSEADIVKNLISYKVKDKVLDDRLDAAQFGQGFQRHLIFTLIRLAAQYQPPAKPTAKKDFVPDMTVLLFEEPEAYLHPTQQMVLARSLREIGGNEGQQVLVSSHSPYFVSHNSEDLPSLIRLNREDKKTVVGKISAERLATIFEDNQEINSLLEGTTNEPNADDCKLDMEAVKYFLWLNPERCGMFFARHVILVEGSTERILFNYLFDQGTVEMPRGGVFVLDCLGKYNIHRFMNLLHPFNVSHSVLYDGDKNKTGARKQVADLVAKLIADSKNDCTHKITEFERDIEAFLGIPAAGQKHRKPQHVMLKLRERAIEKARLDALASMLTELASAG